MEVEVTEMVEEETYRCKVEVVMEMVWEVTYNSTEDLEMEKEVGVICSSMEVKVKGLVVSKVILASDGSKVVVHCMAHHHRQLHC